MTTPPAEYVDLYGHRPLPEYRPSDPEAHRATIEAKRARNAYFRDLEKAALTIRPTMPTRRPVQQGVAPCKNENCKRPTRPSHSRAEDYPDGTILRARGGLCGTCAKGDA